MDYASIKEPEGIFKKKVWTICESNWLESIIMLIIVLNIGTMAMTYET